jgi:hypothetical protein
VSPSEQALGISCPEDTIALSPCRRSQLSFLIQAPSQNTYRGRSVHFNVGSGTELKVSTGWVSPLAPELCTCWCKKLILYYILVLAIEVIIELF